MGRRRITEDTAVRAGAWATEVTGGAFEGPTVGGDLGYGTRYIDGIDQLVWLDPYGARQATAYYLSAGLRWQELSGGDVPEWVSDLVAFLTDDKQPGSVRKAATRGHGDAGSRWDQAQG